MVDRDRGDMIGVLQHWIEGTTFIDPAACAPAAWNPAACQCLPPDDNLQATVFIPDWIDRVMNATVDSAGVYTGWAIGAVGSAVMARPAECARDRPS